MVNMAILVRKLGQAEDLELPRARVLVRHDHGVYRDVDDPLEQQCAPCTHETAVSRCFDRPNVTISGSCLDLAQN